MNKEKLKEVFADEAFVKGLFELESATDVQAALKEKGVELTEEEILGIRELLIKVENGEISVEQLELAAAQLESGELSDELLEQVSGGSLVLCGVLVAGSVVACAMLALCVTKLIIDAVRNRW